MHGTGAIDGLGRNGPWPPIFIQRNGLLHCLWFQSNGDFLHRADDDFHVRIGFRKAAGLDFHAIDAGQQIVDAEFAAGVAGDLALERGFGRKDEDFCCRDPATACVLNDAAEGAAKLLRGGHEGPRAAQEKIETDDCVYLTNEPTHKEEANTRLKLRRAEGILRYRGSRQQIVYVGKGIDAHGECG